MDISLATLGRRPRRLVMVETAGALGYAAAAWMLFLHKVHPSQLGLAGTVLVSLPFLVGRRYLTLGFASALAAFWLSPASNDFGFLALLPMAYVLFRAADRSATPMAVCTLCVALTGPLATALPDFRGSGAVAPFSVVLIASFIAGRANGARRREAESRVLRERDSAASEERLRIAREMHDVLAHSLSVITVQASYGRLVVHEKPDDAHDALAAIESVGREVLAELRGVLGVLRSDESAELAPSPTLSDLPALLAQIACAGVVVDVVRSGDQRPLGPAVELAAYRIVQEALTNVVKHAGVRRAQLTIWFLPDGLELEISDDGTGAATDGFLAGHGLAGMRERAILLGGEFDAGPLRGGGFRVWTRLPATSDALALA